MPDVDLEKLSPELRAALERELAPKPKREDAIAVNFTYDPDDAESVERGIRRGHLTLEDADSWGYDVKKIAAKLGIKIGGDDKGGDDKGGADDDDDGDNPPKRRGYFGG